MRIRYQLNDKKKSNGYDIWNYDSNKFRKPKFFIATQVCKKTAKNKEN